MNARQSKWHRLETTDDNNNSNDVIVVVAMVGKNKRWILENLPQQDSVGT